MAKFYEAQKPNFGRANSPKGLSTYHIGPIGRRTPFMGPFQFSIFHNIFFDKFLPVCCVYPLNIVFFLIVTLKRVIFNYFFSYLLSKEKSADPKGQSLHHTLKRSLQIEGFQNFFFGALEIDSIDKLISSNKGASINYVDMILWIFTPPLR